MMWYAFGSKSDAKVGMVKGDEKCLIDTVVKVNRSCLRDDIHVVNAEPHSADMCAAVLIHTKHPTRD